MLAGFRRAYLPIQAHMAILVSHQTDRLSLSSMRGYRPSNPVLTTVYSRDGKLNPFSSLPSWWPCGVEDEWVGNVFVRRLQTRPLSPTFNGTRDLMQTQHLSFLERSAHARRSRNPSFFASPGLDSGPDKSPACFAISVACRPCLRQVGRWVQYLPVVRGMLYPRAYFPDAGLANSAHLAPLFVFLALIRRGLGPSSQNAR